MDQTSNSYLTVLRSSNRFTGYAKASLPLHNIASSIASPHFRHNLRSITDRCANAAMGWNSWNYFADKVTDKDIRASADQIVASGMRDAGYIYVNHASSWQWKTISR